MNNYLVEIRKGNKIKGEGGKIMYIDDFYNG